MIVALLAITLVFGMAILILAAIGTEVNRRSHGPDFAEDDEEEECSR